ncbi:trimeric intracellular cation channel family protein [Parendozoicomonas sp. Alg238-R29]|uniref:trimeric intracellular cation channel family protein n=1 Tax=Parendozoicomonas sp. Alg238-R29 TaxID=2993446 RepID=UPI00248E2FAD|nr:trimeric intracellular cation channel family protein [Parendozoicomonas sp. Alg238-R29]
MLGALYILAITVEGMSGALAAGRRNMDPVGVIFIACCTAIGGGSVRDVLIGNYPLVWVANPLFLIIIITAAMLTIYISRWMRYLRRAFLILDGIGLMTFTVIGVQKTLALGHSWFIAALMGVFTGVFGGIIRDVMCNRVPLVFRAELYASIAFAAAWLYIGLLQTDLPSWISVVITIVLGFSFRYAAIVREWELPRFYYRHNSWH